MIDSIGHDEVSANEQRMLVRRNFVLDRPATRQPFTTVNWARQVFRIFYCWSCFGDKCPLQPDVHLETDVQTTK